MLDGIAGFPITFLFLIFRLRALKKRNDKEPTHTNIHAYIYIYSNFTYEYIYVPLFLYHLCTLTCTHILVMYSTNVHMFKCVFYFQCSFFLNLLKKKKSLLDNYIQAINWFTLI